MQTIQQLAKTIGVSTERLLQQLEEAGLRYQSGDQSISEIDKQKLLEYLQSQNARADRPRRIALKRRLTKSGAGKRAGRKVIVQAVRKEERSLVIPIRIYLSDEKCAPDVENAIDQFLSKLDGEILHQDEPVFGSWMRRKWAEVKDVVALLNLDKEVRVARHGGRVRWEDKPQSEVTKAHAEAVAMLVQSVANVDEAVIQAGPILVVKGTTNGKVQMVSRLLTSEQMFFIENNPELTKSPSKILGLLSSGGESSSDEVTS